MAKAFLSMLKHGQLVYRPVGFDGFNGVWSHMVRLGNQIDQQTTLDCI